MKKKTLKIIISIQIGIVIVSVMTATLQTKSKNDWKKETLHARDLLKDYDKVLKKLRKDLHDCERRPVGIDLGCDCQLNLVSNERRN